MPEASCSGVPTMKQPPPEVAAVPPSASSCSSRVTRAPAAPASIAAATPAAPPPTMATSVSMRCSVIEAPRLGLARPAPARARGTGYPRPSDDRGGRSRRAWPPLVLAGHAKLAPPQERPPRQAAEVPDAGPARRDAGRDGPDRAPRDGHAEGEADHVDPDGLSPPRRAQRGDDQEGVAEQLPLVQVLHDAVGGQR